MAREPSYLVIYKNTSNNTQLLSSEWASM